MITQHIELPDPQQYRGDVSWHFDGRKYRIVTFTHDDSTGDWPLILERCDSPDEATRMTCELRIRMHVAATLLGLLPSK